MSNEVYRIFGSIFYDLVGIYELNFNRDPRRFLYYEAIEGSSEIIPVYGNIQLPRYILYLTLLPVVSRLSEIKQLAHTYLLYPGASHTRYEHSIGVMLRSRRLFSKVREKFEEKCKAVACLGNDERVILEIAALLHDLGHPSWGHALDGITGYVVALLRETKGIFLFPPRKLDITITLYLLLENEQLSNALNVISLKEIKNDTLRDNFKEIIAQIISEEAPPLFIEGNKELLTKVHLLTTIIGRYKDIGGLDADRLDWLIRDIHHTGFSVSLNHEIAEKLDLFVDLNEKDNFDIGIKNCEFLVLGQDFQNMMRDLREVIYESIYEGLERAFLDSWLTRLAYAAISIIHKAGVQIASASAIARAVMGFLLMHDYMLRQFADRILQLGKQYIRLLGNSEPSSIYISKSADLLMLFNYSKYLMHSLKSASLKREFSPKSNLTFGWLDLGLIDKVLIVIDAKTFGDLLERAYNVCEKPDIYKLTVVYQHLVAEPRMNPIGSLKAALLESQVQAGCEDVNVYLLINYYLFRKLDDCFRDEICDLASLKKVLEEKLASTPFMFIIADRTGIKNLKNIFENACSAILSHLMALFSGST